MRRKNQMNNVFTIRKHGLSCNLRYDFLSYLTLQKLDIYLAQQCLYVEFTLFYNRFISGPNCTGHTSRGEKKTTYVKAWDQSEVLLGTCWGTDWKPVEHIWNSMITLWKFLGNTLGAKGKMRNLPLSSPHPKRKKLGPLECMLRLLIGCM